MGGGTGDAFAHRLRQLFITADIGETITFYRGLPLYPDPARHLARAREGARSGMRPIFEAVAHHNPYPAEAFDETGLESSRAEGAVHRDHSGPDPGP